MGNPSLCDSPYKADLYAAPPGAYLNTAAESPLLRSAADSLLAYARDKARGAPGREAFEATLERTRARAADLLGGDPAGVAFCYTASDAIGMIARSLPRRRGDRVVVSRVEYPSMLLPWLQLTDQGVEVDVVAAPPAAWHTEGVLAQIGPRTRLVAVSAVSYRTGHRADLIRLRDAVHARGGWLLADATQALGAVALRADEADLIVASGFKWLMGVHGAALLYAAPGVVETLRPLYAGWRSVEDPGEAARTGRWDLKSGAHRFEAGMPGFPALYALEAGLAYLQRVGYETVWRRVAGLAGHLIDGLKRLEAPLLTPADPQRRAGIVAFTHPEAPSLVGRLQQEGVFAFAPVPDVVRLSPHFFNDLADVEMCLAVLARHLRGRGSDAAP